MSKYKNTKDPGDCRVRCAGIMIRNPNGRRPVVTIFEEKVVRLADGERRLEDGRTIEVVLTPARMARAFPLRDMDTDEEIAGDGTVGQAMALIYAWVRDRQLEEDAKPAQEE